MLKKRPILLVLHLIYIVLVALFLFWTLFSNKQTLRTGTVLKFRIEGYDPYDPLLGRYLRIRSTSVVEFDSSEQRLQGAQTSGVRSLNSWKKFSSYSKEYYMSFILDEEGYPLALNPVLKIPQLEYGNIIYIKGVKIRQIGLKNRFRAIIPLDRYYLPERIADDIDEKWTYIRRDTDLRQNSWAKTRLSYNGSLIIEDILIAGTSLVDFEIPES